MQMWSGDFDTCEAESFSLFAKVATGNIVPDVTGVELT